MEAFYAACAAVWLQGNAATLHGAGLISEDLVNTLPLALRELKNYGKETA